MGGRQKEWIGGVGIFKLRKILRDCLELVIHIILKCGYQKDDPAINRYINSQ